MKCAACQAEVESSSVYCPKCGEKLEALEEQTPAEETPEAENSAQPQPEEAPATEPKPEPTAAERLREAARSKPVEDETLPPDSGWREGGYSPKALNARFLLTCLATVLLLGLAAWLWWGENSWGAWAWYPSLIAIAGLWGWYLCVRIYRVWTIKYQLTAHQFYHEEGIFRRVRDVIEVIDIDDLKLERTLFDRVINGGVGTVVLRSSDQSDPELKLRGLEDPNAVFQALDNARRRERAQRGLKSV